METPKDSCPVCLEDGEEEKLSLLKPCGHAIHKKCMLYWTEKGSNLCPVCRTEATAFQDGEKIKKSPKNNRGHEEHAAGLFSRNASASVSVARSRHRDDYISRWEYPYPYGNHSAFRNRFDQWNWQVYRGSDRVGRQHLRNNSINEARHNQSGFSDRELRIRSIRFWHSIGHPLNLLEEDFDFRMLRHVFFYRGDPIMLKENIYLALKEFDEKVKNWVCKKKVEIRGTAQKQICN